MESLLANPQLSRFDPLGRILCYDDFDAGLNGWTGLIGNYEDSLDTMLPDYRDLRPPMLSNLTMWDTGTAGRRGCTALNCQPWPTSGVCSTRPFGSKPTRISGPFSISTPCYYPGSLRNEYATEPHRRRRAQSTLGGRLCHFSAARRALTPYIGAGLGAAFVKVSDVKCSAVKLSGSSHCCWSRRFRHQRREDQRVLLPVSTNHTVCSMILKSSLSDMFSM